MKPYTTTIEHILPGMIVRAQDVAEGRTTVLRVLYTSVYREGDAYIGGESAGIEIERRTEVTVLHDPTQDDQEVWISIEEPWDEDVTEAIRRSTEQVLAYHKNRGPQQYKTGNLKTNATSGPF